MKDGTHQSKRRNNWFQLPSFFRQINLLKFQFQKGGEYCSDGVDRISELPDDVLISIISKLSLQEAAAIPTLSSRWRHLHDCTTRLSFPPFSPDIGLRHEHLAEIHEQRFPRFISRINRTLDSYKHGLELEEFRVHMHRLEGAPLERWLEFALSRQIQTIDIHIPWSAIDTSKRGDYALALSEFMMKKQRSLPGLSTLKELSLSEVDVEDGELQLLVSNFPLLRRLSILKCEKLKNVSVAGGSLTHLDLSQAFRVESVELSDMTNLISLRLFQMRKGYILKLDNIPELTEFATEYSSLGNILSGIPSSIHDQLQLLKLSADTDSYTNDNLPIPLLRNVKHLGLKVSIKGYPDLYHLFQIIEACTSLEKLDIMMDWLWFEPQFFGHPVPYRSRTKTLSGNLKTLKLSGYLGYWEDGEMEFVSMVIENAEGLEEIIIEPCDETHVELLDELDADLILTAGTRAWKQLRSITPFSINLKIVGLGHWRNFFLFPLGIYRRILHIVLQFRADMFRWSLHVLNRVYVLIYILVGLVSVSRADLLVGPFNFSRSISEYPFTRN